MNVKAAIPVLAAVALGLGVAGCGSSSRAPGVALAPSAGQTAPVITTPLPTSVPTPKTGPLAKEPTFKVPSGSPPAKLEIVDLRKGTGPAAHNGDQLFVNYVGKLYHGGKVFDASWTDTPGKTFGPIQLGAGSVIAGWERGLLGMKVGGRRELIVPPSLAYGAKGQPPKIPGHATLVFVVDLVKLFK